MEKGNVSNAGTLLLWYSLIRVGRTQIRGIITQSRRLGDWICMAWCHLKSLEQLLYSSITLLTWVQRFPSKDQWYPPHIMHLFNITLYFIQRLSLSYREEIKEIPIYKKQCTLYWALIMVA